MGVVGGHRRCRNQERKILSRKRNHAATALRAATGRGDGVGTLITDNEKCRTTSGRCVVQPRPGNFGVGISYKVLTGPRVLKLRWIYNTTATHYLEVICITLREPIESMASP